MHWRMTSIRFGDSRSSMSGTPSLTMNRVPMRLAIQSFSTGILSILDFIHSFLMDQNLVT